MVAMARGGMFGDNVWNGGDGARWHVGGRHLHDLHAHERLAEADGVAEVVATPPLLAHVVVQPETKRSASVAHSDQHPVRKR